MSEVTFITDDSNRGKITIQDLISAYGTIEFSYNSNNFGKINGKIFELNSSEYCVEVGFTEEELYFKRNKDIVKYPLNMVGKNEMVTCFIFWRPEKIRILIMDSKVHQECLKIGNEEGQEKFTQTLETEPTIPPNDLIDWIRKEAIIPKKTYASKNVFYEQIISMIQLLQDKIDTVDMYDSFWDIQYKGKKIISRKPKHETSIHKTIHGLLFDMSIAKNITVSPEYAVGGGNLDFLFTGTLDNSSIAHTCVEFKNAHSDDLKHGLTIQLPEYMKKQGTDYGIYVVLDYRGTYFDLPKENDVGLDVELSVWLTEKGIKNIRPIILKIGHQVPPSKK